MGSLHTDHVRYYGCNDPVLMPSMSRLGILLLTAPLCVYVAVLLILCTQPFDALRSSLACTYDRGYRAGVAFGDINVH